MRNMEAVERLAASKVSAGAARDLVNPGRHVVDFTVRIHGLVDVGDDETYTPTAELPIKATLALFMRYCGVTRDAAAAALTRAMQEAVRADQLGEDKTDTVLQEISDSQDVINDCWARVERSIVENLPERRRRGKVRSDLAVECHD